MASLHNMPWHTPSLDHSSDDVSGEGELFYRFPAQEDSAVEEIVGASHGRIERVVEMVKARPELSKAVWDWGFGDWESAIGAASHMGRTDIAQVLMDHGARPNVFTYIMFGKLKAVKAIVDSMPGIQKMHGPHGFTMIRHADMRLRRSDLTEQERKDVQAVKDYLIGLGDADIGATSLAISDEEKQVYLGKYQFGDGPDEWFEVTLNRQGNLYVSRGERIGRTLLRVEDHGFAPGGAPSVRVRFEVSENKAKNLVVYDPGVLVKAERI